MGEKDRLDVDTAITERGDTFLEGGGDAPDHTGPEIDEVRCTVDNDRSLLPAPTDLVRDVGYRFPTSRFALAFVSPPAFRASLQQCIQRA
jgi:hypothetical protein